MLNTIQSYIHNIFKYLSNSNFISTGESSATIPTGTNTYPFSFHIPTNIPCSFEHVLGFVRYTVKAVIDRPWRFDHKVVSAFTVVADYDLNAHRNLAVSSFFCDSSHAFDYFYIKNTRSNLNFLFLD